MGTAYGKSFHPKQSMSKSHKEAFNMEKETKIINPHPVEKTTEYKKDYTGERAERPPNCKKEKPLDERPTQKLTQNNATYVNWQNGDKDIFHEKTPQFPVYQLPFRGDTSNQQVFKSDTLRKHKELESKLKKDKLVIASVQPRVTCYETSNQKAYQDFKFHEDAKSQMSLTKPQ